MPESDRSDSDVGCVLTCVWALVKVVLKVSRTGPGSKLYGSQGSAASFKCS